MTYLTSLPADDLNPSVRRFFDGLESKLGHVPAILHPLGLWPEFLEAYRQWYAVIMVANSALPKLAKEHIAVAVSMTNESLHYCAAHHQRNLASFGPAGQNLDARIKGLTAFAIRITRSPAVCCADDIADLRGLGWTDRQILEATIVAAHFNFDNRLVLGLGVEAGPKELGAA